MEQALKSALLQVKTPCYVVDEGLLEQNLQILQEVSRRSGCKILLAQKAFSMFACYPMISQYLAGTTASGLFEAKLGKEEMGGETHVFCAAYPEEDMPELLEICDHFSFNSFTQWEKYRHLFLKSGKSAGIRVNPQHSTQDHGIYDPCALGSRLGVTLEHFREDLLDGMDGLHFHTLCEQGADALVETLAAVEEKFGHILPKMSWVNFGGGHHITKPGYDVNLLVKTIQTFREKYQVQVYLEPGEAVALNAGFLVTSVLDIVENGMKIALLDASAACHMPDVLEMPYRPPLHDGGEWGTKPHPYRLAGATCLAGDVIGDFAFSEELLPGSKLIFEDMAIYSMVKNNTFNGMALPSIALRKKSGAVTTVRAFHYDDFKHRLS